VSRQAHDPEAVATLLERVLSRTRGDAEVLYSARDSALTRFANSQIHQNVAEHDAQIRVRLLEGGRTGVATTNRLDPSGIAEVIERAATARDRAEPNPNPIPLAEPGAGAGADGRIGWSDATAAADPALRADAAREVIAAADGAGMEASGAYTTESATLAVGNSRGVRVADHGTQARLVTVVMGPHGGSGYAQAVGTDLGAVDAAALGAEAVEKARTSAGGTELEPGDYPVVLEEYAVATVLEYLSFIAFSALAAQEGRSFMELGQRVMGEGVRIWDDGHDRSGLAATIDYEGVAKQRVDLVTDGVATGLVHDTATARRADTRSTGHGLPAPNVTGPLAWNLFMGGGTTPREELLARLDRGVWVTRFHYVNVVHAKRGILTGMTKDGTYLVEGGRIVRPVRNLRFTQSIPEAFSRIAAASAGTRLVAAEYTGITARVPALLIDGFTFTGATAADEER
jgi:PmbA protein